jgi:murein L,D-transpeptidase YafK
MWRAAVGLFAMLLYGAEQADRIVVHKAKRELLLLNSGKVIRTYKVALGRNPIGHKQRQGDGKTPEGTYTISARYAQSQYYKALHISYPDAKDRTRAERQGVSPGGDILIHGLPNSSPNLGAAHRLIDWTEGCIALTNAEMDELWRLVRTGTPIEITP